MYWYHTGVLILRGGSGTLCCARSCLNRRDWFRWPCNFLAVAFSHERVAKETLGIHGEEFTGVSLRNYARIMSSNFHVAPNAVTQAMEVRNHTSGASMYLSLVALPSESSWCTFCVKRQIDAQVSATHV